MEERLFIVSRAPPPGEPCPALERTAGQKDGSPASFDRHNRGLMELPQGLF